MKKQELQRTFIIVVLVAAGFFYLQTNKFVGKPGSTNLEIVESEPLKINIKVDQPNVTEKKINKTIVTTDLKKCGDFLNQQSSSDFDAVLMLIKKRFSSNEILELIEYQLRTDDQQEVIVQQNLHEENKNQVRVFKSGEDGFPDRVKIFPNFDGNLQQRLEGALTLGRLERKIDKYSFTSNDGSQVRFEKQQNRITRIDYTSRRNQLICEDKSCACTTY